MEIKRDKYLNELKKSKHTNFIKIITGIRRCGKSYLLNEIFYRSLLDDGVNSSHIIKFAFDNAKDLELIGENLDELLTTNKKISPTKFMQYINSKIVDDGMYYLLLDEVQELGGFEFVLISFLREKNLDVYVTGSNSKFLSRDIVTEFAGRGVEIHVLPLSFSEFYAFYEDKEHALRDYMLYGGLPAVTLMKSVEEKNSYLKNQISIVYLKDMIRRNQLHSDSTNLTELLSVLASNVSALISPNKLSNTIKSVQNISMSSVTINRYISYMEDACIVSKANRYDLDGNRRLAAPYKVYFEDLGLRNAQLNFRQFEPSRIMENIIYNELRYRGFNVDVGVIEDRGYKDGIQYRKHLEIDFVANLGSKRYYVQSTYQMPFEEKRMQETRPFDKVSDSFKKIIITGEDMTVLRDTKGYMTIGLKEFLLDPNSLDL